MDGISECTTPSPAIIHCKKSFHGLSSGALSVNGDDSFREGFGPFLPDCRAIPFNDLAALEAELKKGDVAGFIVEQRGMFDRVDAGANRVFHAGRAVGVGGNFFLRPAGGRDGGGQFIHGHLRLIR